MTALHQLVLHFID